MDYDMNPKPTNERSYVATLLLAFFLGSLGIHRFYTGYILIGIIQLLTAGGCGFWALIDIIAISLNKYNDAEDNELADYNPGCGLFVLIFIVLAFVLSGICSVLSIFSGQS